MARLTLSRERSSSTKRSPLRVAQQRAVAAQRLGQQRPRHGRVVERGGVELHELDVGHGHAGAQRHGHAVAGRLGRVGGDGEQLPVAAGGHEHVGGRAPRCGCAVVRRRRRRRGSARPRRAGRARTSSRRRPRPVGPHGVDERPLDLRAGGRAAGVDDPRAASGRPRGRAASCPSGSRSNAGAEGDELVDPGRALVDEHPHGVDVAQPGAGGERVGQVEVGGVGVAAEHGGHAALGPAGRGLLELGLGEHADAHAVELGGPHRGRQPGHAEPSDEQVEVGHASRSTRSLADAA